MLDQKMTTFIKVVETGNFTEAADRLFITQPAVSQQIKRLEDHYGFRLFIHAGRSFSLTDEGQLVYTYGKIQQANEQRLQSQLKKRMDTLSIGATLSIADYYLPSRLSRYIQKYKKQVRLKVSNTETLIRSMLSGEIMCACIEGDYDQRLFDAHLLWKADFLPVVSADHPLTGATRSLRELFSYPLLVREPGSGTRAILENYLHSNSRSLNDFSDMYEIGNFMTIKKLLQHSQFISFMYEKVALQEVRNGSLAFLRCDDFSVDREMSFIYPKESLFRPVFEQFYEDLIS